MASSLDKLQNDLLSVCRGVFNVPINPDVKLDEGFVVAYIPPTVVQLRPVYIGRKGVANGTYVRSGSSDVKANSDDIQRFSVAAQGGAETIAYRGHHWQNYLDPNKVDDFIVSLNSKRRNIYQSFGNREILLKQKAINDSDDVTLLGLLAFGAARNLQELVAPTINVVITHYAGVSKVNPNNPSETYIDDKSFDGGVVEQFHQAFSYVQARATSPRSHRP